MAETFITTGRSLSVQRINNLAKNYIFIAHRKYSSYREMIFLVGPWSNGYQCEMRIPRPGFNSQRVPDHGC